MREPVFTGACTALVTPFTHSGAVNYDQFARLIDRQLERAAITSIAGFGKICAGAACVLNV